MTRVDQSMGFNIGSDLNPVNLNEVEFGVDDLIVWDYLEVDFAVKILPIIEHCLSRFRGPNASYVYQY